MPADAGSNQAGALLIFKGGFMNLRSKRVQRGIVRAGVAVVAVWAWLHQDVDQAIGAFAFGECLKAWLGITDDDSGSVKKRYDDLDHYLG